MCNIKCGGRGANPSEKKATPPPPPISRPILISFLSPLNISTGQLVYDTQVTNIDDKETITDRHSQHQSREIASRALDANFF